MALKYAGGKMVKVSIIIPIYNVEKYVGQCLESVMKQTLQEIEIICVDDGSTDLSGKIANSYSKIDDRIKVFHRKNAGYGSAINFGLNIATGEYVGIVESDDFVETDMYERLYAIAKADELDYVKSNYYEYNDLDRRTHEEPPICDYGIVYSEYENMNKLYLPKSIWAGLYRRNFLIDREIRLLETPGASYQDTGFWFKVCISAHRGMLIKDAFVNYRIDNDNSSVKSSQKVFCICEEIEECKRYLENSNLRKEIILPYFHKYMYRCYQWNSERIDTAFLEEFLIKTSLEMKDASKILQFDRELLTLPEWESISIWAETPQVYYRMLLNDRIMQYNAMTYAKMFKQYTSEKHIYIYGAGKIGRKLEIIINRFNPDCQVEFIVSNLTENVEYIHSINDANINKKCKVIIAVSDLKVRLEMRRNAINAGFCDIFIWNTDMDYMCRSLDVVK